MNIKQAYVFLRQIMPEEPYFHISVEAKICPNQSDPDERVKVECSIWHTAQEKYYHGKTLAECVAKIREQLPQDVAVKKLIGQEVCDGELRELRKLVNKEYEAKEVPF